MKDLHYWNLAAWTKECRDMEPSRLTELVPLASVHHDPAHWKEKLHILFKCLTDNKDIESVGKALSLEQLHEILYWGSTNDCADHKNKLAPLFVTLPQTLFHGLIIRITPEQLNVLREIAPAESVQHQLSILSHHTAEQFDALCNAVTKQEKILEHIDFDPMGLDDINKLYITLENILHQGMEIIHVTQRVLALAWNTNRPDIIQELSRIKELCHRCITENIGSPAANDVPTTGLWEILRKRINSIFGEVGSNGVFTPMKDTDPAIEALVKFSVWYLSDYYDIGLLSGSVREDISELDNAPTGDAKLAKKREHLFALAEGHLDKIGIATLYDLKRARILSRRALKDYISLHGS